MKTRAILELHTTRTVCAMLALASLFLSLAPRPAGANVSALSKRSDVAALDAANYGKLDSEPADRATAPRNYDELPLSFEPNQGQADPSVKFLSRGKGYTLFLTPTEAVLRLQMSDCGKRNPQSAVCNPQSSVLRMKLLGARAAAPVTGQDPLEGKVNYLIGNDQSKWQRNVPTFRGVRYDQVWPGVDMLWHGRQQELEYDFIVQPGADPSQIRLGFEGADKLRFDGAGNLLVHTSAGEVVHHAPVIFQDGDHGRTTVAGKYVLLGKREVGFKVETYDASKPLVIDPLLIYSTYLGGTLLDAATGIAVNSAGEAFITGQTSPPSTFPRNNELAVQNDNSVVAFVTKLRADGTGTVYSTLIGNGGFGGNVEAEAIAITSDGNAAITGNVDNRLGHSEFPVTGNAYQDAGRDCIGVCNGRGRSFDAFVMVLNAQGNGLFYSTFFAGSSINEGEQGNDLGEAIAVDSGNRLYITGSTSSNNLPTQNAFQSSRKSSGEGFDAFVAVFDPSQERGNDTLLYASYLGGEGDDIGRGVAVDAAGNAYVVGSTASTDLKTKSPSGLPPLQENFQGGGFDGFAAKVDTKSKDDNSLTYLTYFGGNINDRVESVAVDSSQRAYITGASNSSPGSFPLKNPFDSAQTNGEAFVAKLNADGTALFYCSFLGGANGNTPNDGEEGLGIAIDSAGNAYVTGRTTSGDTFPLAAVAPPFPAGVAGTAFVAKVGASVSNNSIPKLLYSTTFGGRGAKAEAIAIDPRGNVYITGFAAGDFPTTPLAFQTKFNGGETDGFVAKISTSFEDTIGVFRPANNQFLLRNSNSAGPPDKTITFGVAGDLPITGDWDGNGVDDVGIFRPTTQEFLLRLPNERSFTTIRLTNFGQPGDLPVAGDWNGDGIDTPGVFTPLTGQWLLTNGNTNNTTPPVNFNFTFGQNGDTPLAGDWNGDGFDTPGLFRNGIAQFILSNGFQGTIDIPPFLFGALGQLPLAGDWDGDGVATIGVFNPNIGTMALNNTNSSGNGIGDLIFNFGQNGDLPLAGDWDGQPTVPTN